MKNQFISWLESEKPKSVRHYSSGYNTIENILSDNNLSSLDTWSIINFENNLDNLKSLETFNSLNTSGKNILTATLSNYKKFMIQQDKKIIPTLIFDSFGWRWASTGIASHLNQPKSLKIILDALLINGNGQNNYTKAFKDLVYKLCVNKYNIDEEESDKLTKLSNPNDDKNIIENSANYWYHLGLLETTGKNALVSELGEKFLNGQLSNDEFVKDRIKNYTLPNNAYKNTETSKWISNDLKIYPFKLIQDIFKYLSVSFDKDKVHLTEEELSKIIIPCSSNLNKYTVNFIVNSIIEFRKNPSSFSSWPSPQKNYTDDKGFRMANEFLYFLEAFDFLDSNKKGVVRSADKKYIPTYKFLEKTKTEKANNNQSNIKLDITVFKNACEESGLNFERQLIQRFVSSLATKPFVLLTGLSGSGKTKLAQAFAKWICASENQYSLIPVGADWTNREPLLGYPNALNDKEYVKPDNRVLDLLFKANDDDKNPYFLILDEMNLSHVERYFADFLSTMESKDDIPLHDIEEEVKGIRNSIKLPNNLFIIGTVNIDETTYMFSPKVLDRANTIEFRVVKDDIKKILGKPKGIDLDELEKGGVSMAENFVQIATPNQDDNFKLENPEIILDFFEELKKSGAEFGYRTAYEISKLIFKLEEFGMTELNDRVDVAILQKMLPKLHGSRTKLQRTLKPLAKLCLKNVSDDDFEKKYWDNPEEIKFKDDSNIKYKISFEKIIRMYKNAIENGFASYAEA